MLADMHTEKLGQVMPRYKWEDNINMCLKEICIRLRTSMVSPQDGDYWIIIETA